MKILSTIILMSFLSLNMNAQKLYDCYEFDMAGVKLGMEAQEAARIIMKMTGTYPRVSEGNRPLGEFSQDIYQFDTEDGVQIIIRALPAVPITEEQKMQVVSISFVSEDTPQNRQSMMADGAKKYGTPTSLIHNGTIAFWASKLLAGSEKADYNEPILYLSSTTMELQHKNYEYVIFKNYLNEQSNVKTKF